MKYNLDEFLQQFGIEALSIKYIQCDYKNKVTVVVFVDDSKSICRCSKEDEYNEYAGICICLAKHMYGKSKLEKIINSKKKVVYNNFNKEEK